MWNKLIGHLKSKRILLGSVALGGLLVTSIVTVNLSGTAGQLAQLGKGMQICFSRVGQSFTARMLGNMKSTYLDPGFMATTEECLGDVIYKVTNEFQSVLGKSSKNLNMLASNIHWFHEKVTVEPKSGLVTDIDIEERFSNLEGDVDDFINRVEQARGNYLESNSYLSLLMGMLALLTPFLFGWYFYERRNLDRLNKEVEADACNELKRSHKLNDDAVRSIIGRALNQNELINCSKLFNEFSLDIMDQKPSAFMPVVYDEQEHPVKEKQEETITHLSGVFSNIVSNLSDKLFGQEIFFDVDIDEDLYIEASKEAVEQTLFYMISATIKRFDASDIVKRILVKSKKLGGTTLFEVEDSSRGFGEDFITGDQDLSLDLKICQEVAKDFGGTLVLENLRNREKQIKGCKMQLTFRTAAAPVKVTKPSVGRSPAVTFELQ